MAPGTRRAGRGGFAEHDDFEGLPVRQWRQEVINIAPPPPVDQQQQNDVWAVELIHGMPKDSNLLAPHSQELLRAARSGRLYKRPAPEEDTEADADAVLAEKAEKKEEDITAKGFMVKLWKQIPRNVDAGPVSHLAKRRKNTITIASKTVRDDVPGPTVTRATVKRIDAAGNAYTEDVTLVAGQQVNGEIIATRIEPAPLARTDSLHAAATPQRRRPPPPKRKSKAGPGRGKKKIKNTIPLPVQAPVPTADGAVAPVQAEGGSEVAEKPTGNETPNQDSEMADGDDDEDDNEEGGDGDDGEEGDEGEEGDGDETGNLEQSDDTKEQTDQDHEMTDAPAVDVSLQADSVAKTDAYTPATLPPLNPLSLAPPLGSPLSASVKLEGSPLKNVVPLSPPDLTKMETEPQTAAAPIAESTIAEPPSTIVGEGPEAALERDVPMAGVPTDEALLPPPPDQVGNIASPKAEDGETASGQGSAPASALERPSLAHLDSAMTDDSIKPDDSASVISPIDAPEKPPTEIGMAASEAVNAPGTPSDTASTAQAVVEEVQNAPEETASPKIEAAEPAHETALEPPTEESVPTDETAPSEEEDILGGAMAALDRQAQDGTHGAELPKEPEAPIETKEASETTAPTEQPGAATKTVEAKPEQAPIEEKPESDPVDTKSETQAETEAVKPDSPEQEAATEAEAEMTAEPTETTEAPAEQAGLANAASDAGEAKQAGDDDGEEEGAAPANA